jgi:DNA-binding transcriptional LysR family regulator
MTEASGHLLERARTLRGIWDYLPAFRAVAETEHLPTAARALHVSPSALSRTIHLTEAHVGQRLFERSGRALRLNGAGHALLAAVRDAMRLVDEGLGALDDAGLVGTVVVGADADLIPWLAAPALVWLHAAHPRIVGELVVAEHDVTTSLQRGAADVVVTARAAGASGVEVELLATVRWTVFTAPGARRSSELVAVAGAPSPAHRLARVAAVVPDAMAAAAACAAGLRAWLPEPLAVAHGLRRVRGQPFEMVPVHAISRKPVTSHARTEAALAALRAASTAHGRRR